MTASPLWTIQETADYLRTTPAALYTQRHRGDPPGALGIQVGKRILFREDDIYGWLNSEQYAYLRDRQIGAGVESAEQILARTSPQLHEVWTRFRGRCGICGEHVHPHSATRDHIVPRSKGGSDDRSNIQLAHHGCNARKGSS